MRNKSIIKTDDTIFFHRRDKELIEGIKRLREVSLSNRKISKNTLDDWLKNFLIIRKSLENVEITNKCEIRKVSKNEIPEK